MVQIEGRKVIDMKADSITLNEAVLMSIMHWFLIVYGMLQALEIIKVQQKIGQTVKLVEAVLVDVAAFVLFFASWVLIFSFLHRLLGNEVDASHDLYTDVTEAISYFLHTWILSTGGGKTNNPHYLVWFDRIGTNEPESAAAAANPDTEKVLRFDLGVVMIYATWLSKMINEILVNKILLSFLIAMVGKTLNRMNSN